MRKYNRQVVGLDIGTTKVSAVVGELTPEGGLEIIGVGHRPSKGLRRGVIVDMDGTVEAVAHVIEDAQLMAGTRIDAVYVGLGGGQVEGLMTEGSIELTAKEVTPKDVQQVIGAVRSLALADGHEILDVLPIEYRLDEEAGISNPVGMSGTKLGVWAQVITATAPGIESLLKVLGLVGVGVQEIVAQPLASGRAVLTADERDLGVALIDIGGGTSDVAIYRDGALQHLSSLVVGGNHITHDLAVGLRTPVAEAERIKRQYGCALLSLIDADDMVDVPALGAKEIQPIPRRLIAEIIGFRVEEIFALALHRMQQSGFSECLSGGVVMTGGAAVMPGMLQVAETVFECPVRLGLPQHLSGLTDLVNSPMYTAAVGLTLCGRDRLLETAISHPVGLGVGTVFRRMATWVQNFF